jgi:hypothetical protein
MDNVTFRQLNRLSLSLPVKVCSWKHPVKAGVSVWQMDPEVEYTTTENISSGGCYFMLSQEPPLGARLEMEITIPGNVPEVPFARVYCQGVVIRVDHDVASHGIGSPLSRHKVGVATTIERLQDVQVESVPRPVRQHLYKAFA